MLNLFSYPDSLAWTTQADRLLKEVMCQLTAARVSAADLLISRSAMGFEYHADFVAL